MPIAHRAVLIHLSLSIVSFFAGPRSAGAQTGLLIVAHGATAEWNARVKETVAQVSWTEGPVATSFLMGPEAQTASLNAGVTGLVAQGARSIVVVPLMISSAGGHYHQIRYLVGEIDELPSELAHRGHHGPGADRVDPGVPVRVTRALDGSAELGRALADLWDSLPNGDRKRPLVFVAHGPSRQDEAATWLGDLGRVTAPIAERAGVPHWVGLLKDDAPPAVRAEAIGAIRDTITSLAGRSGDSVMVLPILVSRGDINNVKIPKDLAGLPIRYQPVSLAPSPHLARWIERVALASLADSR